jgi:hypothetical protein
MANKKSTATALPRVPALAGAEASFEAKLRNGFYETKLEYKDDKEAWNTDQARLHELFEKDMFHRHEVTNNLKKDKCYQIAWELGHSYGYQEVAGYFSQLVELIK